MARKEVLLLKPVEGLGNEGEQVNVRAGYARNYLLRKKLAVPMTEANRKQMEALLNAREQRLARELSTAEEMVGKLRRLHIAIPVKTGPGGKLFGSVSANDLKEWFTEEGIEVERKRIMLHTPVKSLGKHETRIKLHPEVSVDIEFEVVSENPIEEEGP
jgi:large subunit ribosomal protein L9